MIHWQPALPERYLKMSEEQLAAAIRARREQLGDNLLILGHHYQQDSVIQHADLTGDSLKLSRMAANEATKRGTKWIVFCGVHFMAETADILTDDSVQVILPDLSAGCSMADMANYEDTVEAWETIAVANTPFTRVIPITYVNSSAAIKAFVGEHGGACCTSSNALEIFKWALAGGTTPKANGETIKVLFLPDQHLGRNTASKMGFLTEVDEAAGRGKSETALWNPHKESGGLTPEQIREATVYLWAGHCSVHKLFRPEHVEQVREAFRDKGGITVIVHPECCKEVVDLADLSGSTESIITTIRNAPPGSNWAVGTEIHLVNRLAHESTERSITVRILSDCQCLCTTMYRIDQQHLLWTLDNLASGKVVNRISVVPRVRELATLALERMLANVSSGTQPPATRIAPKRNRTSKIVVTGS
ncbi:MAG TPA: quinolinate synthase NadA [Phycisphaerales bacterium]|nr:quinolinate synthase NadA [Phycisphaerales bacterium]HRQ76041.1 quinolinate synthase NadA [Phycisphaerales bacterium]